MQLPGSGESGITLSDVINAYIDDTRNRIAAANGKASIALEKIDAATTLQSVDDFGDGQGYDVIALIGQSNMVGRGKFTNNTEYLPAKNSRVFAFNAKGKTGNEIVPAADPLVHQGPGEPRTDAVGSGTTFANEYLNLISTNRKVLLVPAAMGATGFISGAKRWRTTHTPTYNNLYLMALKQIKLALDAAGPGSRLVGCLWHQGEADGYLPNPNYTNDLHAVVSGIRSEFNVPDMWFLLGQMSQSAFDTSPGRVAINAAHIAFPSTEYLTALAYTPYGAHNDEDTTHFNICGLRALGRSYARALPLALANVSTSTPVPPSAVYAIQGRPDRITIEWDRPVCRFTDFVVQYRASGTETWSTWSHTASLHNVAELPTSAGSSAEVRVATVNENGTSEYSDVFTVAKTVYPEELFSPAPWRVFSLRKMISSYSGVAIRVRRASDNAEQDINFRSDGLLDEDALAAFCVDTHGYVVRWHDQTGNTSSFQQPTASMQPQIVDAGVVIKVGGRPAVKFNGTSHCLYTNTTGVTSGMTAAFVARIDKTDGTNRLLSEGSSTTDTPMYSWYTGSTGLVSTMWRSDSNVTSTVQLEEELCLGKLQSLVISDGVTNIRARSNNFTADPVVRNNGSLGTTTVNRQTLMALGRTSFGSWSTGVVSELIIWQSQFNPSFLNSLVDNQNRYYSLIV